MPRLKYIIIDDKEHLTFESIRRLALRQLSKPDELKARKHLNRCSRCQGIYDSFVVPGTVRKRRSRRKTASRVLTWVLLLLSIVGSASIFLSKEGTIDLSIAESVMDLNIEEVVKDWNPKQVVSNWNIGEQVELSELFFHRLFNRTKITKITPKPPATEVNQDFISLAFSPLKTIDILNMVNDASMAKARSTIDQTHPSYSMDQGEEEQLTQRGIYGTITADGDPLKGVTVMVPGGKTARVSDEQGKYYLQIPDGTNSLVLIYQGKQLIEIIDPDNRQQNIQLQLENMSYPEIEVFSPITDNF